MEEPGLIERLREEHYDVYISENFDVCGIGLYISRNYLILHFSGLAHAIQPTAVIGTSATTLFGWQFDEFGVPEAVNYRPGLMTFDLISRMIIARSFHEKFMKRK